MYKSELPYFVLFTILFLATPFLPSPLLLVFDNIIIRIGIVFVLLFLITKGPLVGVLGLLVIASIYLERNRRKLIVARTKLDKMDINTPQEMTVLEESKPQQTVPVNSFDIPVRDDEMPYIPTEDCSSDNFEPVGPSINMKHSLNTIEPGAASNDLFEEMGFGHIGIN
jgi:hypothetical protein